jgi:hypothetical protein
MLKALELNTFLEFAYSQRELSILVVEDKADLEKHLNYLKESGFHISESVSDYFQRIGIRVNALIVGSQENMKMLYDIASQYPTGQITLFETTLMKNIWITPQYDLSTKSIIVTKEELNNAKDIGILLLASCGLAYNK